jgi:ankyrin repeat protein
VGCILHIDGFLGSALFSDHADVVQLLIEHGSNLEANDLHFGRPLHVAALKGHLASAKRLLQAGTSYVLGQLLYR